jgi:aryl-alcohol dehydrogenase-like predicted oxidoreductase
VLFRSKLVVDCYCTPQNFERLDRVKQLAGELNLSIPQVALAYVLSQPLNIFALVGCRTREEFVVNTVALDTKLSPKQLAWLDLREDES